MAQTADAVIIGGGVMGCSIQYYLAQLGITNTLLLEKDVLASGSTGHSQAILRMHYSNEVTARFAWESLQVFKDFEAIVGSPSGYKQTGYVLIVGASDRQAMEANVAMHKALGINVELVAATDLRDIAPMLAVADTEACAYEPESGYADPYAVTTGYARRARALGARIQSATRVREAHDLILKAWRKPEVFAWNGTYYKLRYVNPWPRPLQKPPPIWIPGGGSIETWDFCAERHYNYSYLSFSGYMRGVHLMRGFWQRLEETGYDFNPYQGAFAQQIVVADTDAEAQAQYERHVRYFFERCLHVWPGFADAPGYRTEAAIRAGLQAQVGGPGASSALALKLSWQELIEQGFIAAGSPTSVAAQLQRLITSLQVGHLVCLLHIGDMPTDKCRASTKLFAEQVIPQLRHHWRGYEDHLCLLSCRCVVAP